MDPIEHRDIPASYVRLPGVYRLKPNLTFGSSKPRGFTVEIASAMWSELMRCRREEEVILVQCGRGGDFLHEFRTKNQGDH